MQFGDSTQAPAVNTVGASASGNSNIVIPAPERQAKILNHSSDEAAKEKYEVPVVPLCRYLKNKVSGEVYPYSDDLAARGDVVEQYNPSLAELISFGEDLAELSTWGFTPENFVEAGVSLHTLTAYGILAETDQVPQTTPAVPVAETPAVPVAETPAVPLTMPEVPTT